MRVPPFRDWVPTLGLIGAVALAFVVEFRTVLKVGHLTSGTIWNADIALYVNEAGALVTHGFGWAGNIANVNLGAIATNSQGIGPGVYATLAAAASFLIGRYLARDWVARKFEGNATFAAIDRAVAEAGPV